MPNVQMQDDVLTAIYNEALNSVPYGSMILQKMLVHRKRNQQQARVYQRAYDRVCKRNRDVLTPENKEAILKQATQKVLQEKFGLPNVDLNAYNLKIGRGKITLKFNPGDSKAIPLVFWANKQKVADKTISKAEPEPQRMKLTPQEVEIRLNENMKWAKQKEVYKERLREFFTPTENQIKEIFKDGQPGNLDFSNCEITGFDFSKHDLRGTVFENARLKDCKFNEASHADFSGAEIHDCSFQGADLRYTTFERADMQRVVMTRAQLDYTSFNDARPQALDLSGSHTDHTCMDWTEADNVIFDTLLVEDVVQDIHRSEEKAEAPFEGTYLPQQTFDTVMENHRQWLETDGREGQRADLRGARLGNIDVSGKDLSGVLVHQHDLRDIKYNTQTKFPENIVAPHVAARQQMNGKSPVSNVAGGSQDFGDFGVRPDEAARFQSSAQTQSAATNSPLSHAGHQPTARPPIAPTHEMMP